MALETGKMYKLTDEVITTLSNGDVKDLPDALKDGFFMVGEQAQDTSPVTFYSASQIAEADKRPFDFAQEAGEHQTRNLSNPLNVNTSILEKVGALALQEVTAVPAQEVTVESAPVSRPEFDRVKVFAGGAAALTLVGVAYKAVAKMFGKSDEAGQTQENRGAGILGAITSALVAFGVLAYTGPKAGEGEDKSFNLKNLFVKGVEHIKALVTATESKGQAQG